MEERRCDRKFLFDQRLTDRIRLIDPAALDLHRLGVRFQHPSGDLQHLLDRKVARHAKHHVIEMIEGAVAAV